MRKSSGIGALLLACGCYRYVSVPPVAVPQGAQARVVLTARGLDDVTKFLQSSFEEPIVTGKVVDNTRGIIALDVTVGAFPTRLMTEPQHHEYLQLAAPDYATIEIGRLDRIRTTAAAIGAAGFLTIVVAIGLHALKQ